MTLERSAMRKIYWRLLPFAILTYLLCYIDRINVSFAALTMRSDLGMSAQAFGFAAGTFYWGYFVAEVPSNIILEKVGARIWIARIMITWGLLSGATAYVSEISAWLNGIAFLAPVAHHITPTSTFAVVRCLLGLAEAGFFPGLILYFTYWFPSYHHGRIVSAFLTGLPIAVAAGAPVSTALLGLDGWFGLKGWQVMYLAEAIPTVFLGFVTLFYMTDKPVQAQWLSNEERSWLTDRLQSEREAKDAARQFGFWEALFNPTVLLLSLNYFGIVVASLGVLLFVPQIIKSLGNLTNFEVGLVTMIPYIMGGISMIVWGRISDRMHERRWNLFWSCALATIGLVVAGWTMGTWWAVVGVTLATMGFYGSKGPFWAMPPMFLTGTAAAGTIAWINSIGNLGGFFGPWWVGFMKDATGSFAGGLYGLALLCFVSAAVCALFLYIPNRIVEQDKSRATGGLAANAPLATRA
jgi:ACS family tartrate transporter-like MFS transporter